MAEEACAARLAGLGWLSVFFSGAVFRLLDARLVALHSLARWCRRAAGSWWRRTESTSAPSGGPSVTRCAPWLPVRFTVSASAPARCTSGALRSATLTQHLPHVPMQRLRSAQS